MRNGGKGGAGGANNGGGKGNIGISSIPPDSRKMVQRLKEIVNCPEPEIYATLKDCSMDPDEAVNRLLTQDPFREVKSKRDKKKPNKDTMDFRSQGTNNASSHGGRSGADRYAGRGGLAQVNVTESGGLHGKPPYKMENGTYGHAGSSSFASAVAVNNVNQRPPSYSDFATTENKTPTLVTSDGISASSQTSSGLLPAWVGVPGQVSMADIVKRGRPQNKATCTPKPPRHSANHHYATTPPAVSEFDSESEPASSQHVPPTDEWPLIEKPLAVSLPSVLGAHADSKLYAEPSNLALNRPNLHVNSQLGEVEVAEDSPTETNNSNHIPEDNSRGSSLFDNNLYENMSSYQSHRHPFEHNEAEDGASSVSANLQQLILQSDDQGPHPEEDNRSVIIPDHLQVHTPDCSHLSFGSFGSGIGSTFSGTFASRPLKNNLEEASEAADASLAAHPDTRNPEYYVDDHLRNNSDENIVRRASANAGNYDSPSVSQPEVLKQEAAEESQGNQYTFPSAPVYDYENTELDAAFTSQQTSSQMQNLAPFSSVMQAYTNSLPSTLLASTVQTAREPELPYSPFTVTQSMPTKFSNTASTISGSSISLPEALRAGSISTPQPTPQTLPGANVATGPALPQHLAMHPYSQPTLTLGHFANMISYPFLPQSYTYMPSAFQQGFAGNSTYHQSLAAMLPQYKNSVSVSSLPQSAAIASGYGFGSSTSIPGGNFPMNPPTTGTTIGYDDVLSSQYKDANHLMSLQQNDNMWVHGHGSRTMSAVPGSTYYSFQGQNQPPGGFRQGQQPSQHFGAHGYPNYYHSQTGISVEHQQQKSRDGSLGSGQGQASKQTQQLWQNTY
ncbi:DUF1296 domain-containing protein [Cephalotus follicularis]|uniref:DUF1296 domain-containing protein n=1 Tax=Cephalotus follicularis TaxID=3775 RepID=A0A1Q3CH94_CEPFO|nr:DUF1296 domain-containing protein [Cephalotus follicularis]